MTRAEGNAGPDTGTGSNIVKVVAASMAGGILANGGIRAALAQVSPENHCKTKGEHCNNTNDCCNNLKCNNNEKC